MKGPPSVRVEPHFSSKGEGGLPSCDRNCAQRVGIYKIDDKQESIILLSPILGFYVHTYDMHVHIPNPLWIKVGFLRE